MAKKGKAKKRVSKKKRNVIPKTDETPDTGNVDEHGIPVPGKPKQRKKITPEQRKYMLERELRRYVKRDGGFRKNLPKEKMEVAKRIMKKLGREKPEWDPSIVIFGVDKPTVARINVDGS